jgi:predicted lipoprotein
VPSVFTACDVCLRINGLHIAAGWKQIYGLMLHWIGLAPNERFRAMEEALRPLIAGA